MAAGDVKVAYGAATSLTVTGLNSLAGGSLATSDAIDNTSNLYLDYLIEVVIADITEAGNKQVVLYAISSVDGTNYSDNQSSNLPALRYLGSLPMNGSGAWRNAAFSVAAAFGGVIPPKFKIVIYNDNSTTALASSGNSAQYRGVYNTIAQS
jgi:hypothetical protein